MAMTSELYPYQREAFDVFMARGNLLLGFDPGLGKTITAIAAAEDLLERREIRKVLVVVPASLKYQWARSLAQFTDLPAVQVKFRKKEITIPDPAWCVIVDGPPEKRGKLYTRARLSTAQYVITGYDQVVSDHEWIASLGFGMVILDEASAIKNPGTQQTKAVRKYLKVPYRLALTATPIENKPEEVYSIMKYVDETVLGRHDLFDRAYIKRNPWGGVSSYVNLDVLHDKLAAAMVRKRRTDPDVAPYMPDVDTEVWRVEMDGPTRDAYRLMAADLMAACDDQSGTGTEFNVDIHYGVVKGDARGDKTGLGRLVSVRGCMEMLLAHPVVLARSAELYETTETQGSRYAWEWRESGRPFPTTSPKLDYLAGRACEILEEDPGAKILVFTWFKSVLPVMADRFSRAGYDTVTYHGGMNARNKEAAVQQFKTDPGTRVFLSSHAGAYGTDLPEANVLVNYDVPWSSGRAFQINGRHVRASSEFRFVRVIDMVMPGTVEERRLQTRDGKGAVSRSAIDGRGPSALKNEVRSLRQHAESVLDTSTHTR